MELAQKALVVHQKLIDFYGYPEWRNPLPALDELVSTILSQNTNDVNRDVAFDALVAKFPSWEAVRDADEEVVVEAIRPAGLANQKGPRIQHVLRQITEMRGELDISFLKDYTPEEATRWLVQFKGVGPKTAAIVLQFSLDIPAFPVDTHVHRFPGEVLPVAVVELADGDRLALVPPLGVDDLGFIRVYKPRHTALPAT